MTHIETHIVTHIDIPATDINTRFRRDTPIKATAYVKRIIPIRARVLMKRVSINVSFQRANIKHLRVDRRPPRDSDRDIRA